MFCFSSFPSAQLHSIYSICYLWYCSFTIIYLLLLPGSFTLYPVVLATLGSGTLWSHTQTHIYMLICIFINHRYNTNMTGQLIQHQKESNPLNKRIHRDLIPTTENLSYSYKPFWGSSSTFILWAPRKRSLSRPNCRSVITQPQSLPRRPPWLFAAQQLFGLCVKRLTRLLVRLHSRVWSLRFLDLILVFCGLEELVLLPPTSQQEKETLVRCAMSTR